MNPALELIKLGLAQAAAARDIAAFDSWFAALVEEIMLDAIDLVMAPCPN